MVACLELSGQQTLAVSDREGFSARVQQVGVCRHMSGAGALLSFGLSFPPPTRCCCVISTPVSCMQLSALLFADLSRLDARSPESESKSKSNQNQNQAPSKEACTLHPHLPALHSTWCDLWRLHLAGLDPTHAPSPRHQGEHGSMYRTPSWGLPVWTRG